MVSNRLSGVEKASILLLSLDEDSAAKILRNMDPEDISKISRCMAKLSVVPREEAKKVLMEIKSSLDQVGIVGRGMDFVRKLVTKALGEKRSEEVIRALSESIPIQESTKGSEMHFDSRMLATLIQDEHPQIIALTISFLSPDKAKDVLMELPDDLRVDVIYRISKMESVPPDVMDEIRDNLKRKVFSLGMGGGRRQGGMEKVMNIVKKMEKSYVDSILEGLRNIDPDFAEKVEANLFTFDDLINLSDRDVQMLLREVDSKTLVLALKAASDELKDLFLRNMSKRAREMLIEDMEVMGPVKLRDVEAAQHKIVEAARKLEEEGKLVLQKGEGGEILV